jgi:hypothetical protein
MRRTFLLGLLGGAATLLLGEGADARRPPFRGRRRVRRRVRRRMRRMRRRGRWAMRGGRRLLLVPVGLAVGWELMVENRVALVQSVSGGQVVVRYTDGGATETVAVAMENTPDNSEVLPGSEYEAEVEEEVDE